MRLRTRNVLVYYTADFPRARASLFALLPHIFMQRRLLFPAIVLVALAACDSPTDAPAVASLDVTPKAQVLKVGTTTTLMATAKTTEGKNVSPSRIQWSSTAPAIATVNDQGVVTGVTPGVAKIVATAGEVADTARVAVGSVLINAQSDFGCSNAIFRAARVAATSNRAIILEDVENPAGGFTDQDHQVFAKQFDDLVYPVAVRNFGEPGDFDRNDKVIIFFTRAVNELTAPNSNSFVGGFFFGRDLFPKTATNPNEACAGSNEGELFYLLAPDPAGEVNQNVRTKEFVQQRTLGVIAHEFQHLINASRRLFVNNAPGFEEVWLNEGLSHIAEELMFYATTPLEPRQNIDRPTALTEPIRTEFLAYQSSNFGRFIRYLQEPRENSLLGVDNLPTRGAIWAFLRYAADRRAGEDAPFWFSLVNSKASGVANLAQVLQVSPLQWMQDWTVSVYTDDAGIGVAPRFMQPSWNFRSIMPAYSSANNRYPLDVIPLKSDTATTLTLKAGGAAYFRFGVAAGERATITTTSGGAAIPGGCPSAPPFRVLNVGDVYTAAPDSAGALCLEGGAGGSEFTLIPFFASDISSATLALEITGTNVRPVVGPPNPFRAPSASFARVGEAELVQDFAFEQRLRERERREMGALLRPGSAANAARSSFSSLMNVSQLRLSVVRTK